MDPSGHEGLDQAQLVITDTRPERLQIVADVLAKSVVLSRYGGEVRETFDRVQPLAVTMARRGRGVRHARELVSHIGSTLLTLHRMVGRVEAGEKPDTCGTTPSLSGCMSGWRASTRSTSASWPWSASWRSSSGPRRPSWTCC